MFSSPGWYDCQPGPLIIRNRIYTYLKKKQERSETKQNFLTIPAALRELEKIEMIKLWNKINKFSDIKRRQRTVPCLPGGLFSGVFSSEGLVVGIVIGLIWYFSMKKRNTARNESASTVDGEEVETQVVEETVHYNQMNSGY